MSQSPFQKFVSPKKNSVIKEEFKQAKKKAKKDRAAAINKRFEEKRQMKAMRQGGNEATRDRGECAKRLRRARAESLAQSVEDGQDAAAFWGRKIVSR